MAFDLRVYPADRLAVVRLGPSVTGLDLVRASEALLTDESWAPTFRVVWDWRRVAEVLLLPEDVDLLRRRTRALRERLGSGQTAHLVEREDDEATAVMLGLRAWKPPHRERRVFRRATEAAAWLGISPRRLRPSGLSSNGTTAPG
jgi:hypothetical protein